MERLPRKQGEQKVHCNREELRRTKQQRHSFSLTFTSGTRCLMSLVTCRVPGSRMSLQASSDKIPPSGMTNTGEDSVTSMSISLRVLMECSSPARDWVLSWLRVAVALDENFCNRTARGSLNIEITSSTVSLSYVTWMGRTESLTLSLYLLSRG